MVPIYFPCLKLAQIKSIFSSQKKKYKGKRYHWPGLVLFYIIQGLVLSISHLKHAKFSALRNYVHLCRNISIMYKSRVESMQIRIYFWTCNMSPSFSRVYCYCISSWRYSLWFHDVFKIFDALAGIINSVFR